MHAYCAAIRQKGVGNGVAVSELQPPDRRHARLASSALCESSVTTRHEAETTSATARHEGLCATTEARGRHTVRVSCAAAACHMRTRVSNVACVLVFPHAQCAQQAATTRAQAGKQRVSWGVPKTTG
eukprot:1156819-Pelagomonas_calceolata.AAC.2